MGQFDQMKDIFRVLLTLTSVANASQTQVGSNPDSAGTTSSGFIHVPDVACFTLTGYLSQSATISVDQSADGGAYTYYTNDYAIATGVYTNGHSIEALCPWVRLRLQNGAMTQTAERIALCGRKVT